MMYHSFQKFTKSSFIFTGFFQDIYANGGAEFYAINNTFDVLHQYSIDVRNVKKSMFDKNNFGFVTKAPFLVLDFDKYVTGGNCDSEDLSYKDIDVNFKDNVRFCPCPSSVTFIHRLDAQMKNSFNILT